MNSPNAVSAREKHVSARVIVANQSEACLYDIERPSAALQLSERLIDPDAHRHDRDLVSDRPGRVFDHGPLSMGRRGATAHHGVGGERRPRQQEALRFARRIAAALANRQRRMPCDRLILMAAPRFLGLLRQALPRALQSCVVAEVRKDMVGHPLRSVRRHLTDEMLREPLGAAAAPALGGGAARRS